MGPTVDREDMLQRVAVDQQLQPSPKELTRLHELHGEPASDGVPVVMRKNMTRCLLDLMDQHQDMVYVGEDVRHGGYYLVTEGMAEKHPHRIRDFPPDETSLIGAGMGFSQAGLLPVVEIPYAKYLDCGYDMFEEAGIMSWLTNGRQRNPMIIRLQGFGPGVFGGNFHTHNTLHIPPGVTTVCFSNGADWVRGWRQLVHMARNGAVVMSVDCTALLNQRHAIPGDEGWKNAYPTAGVYDLQNEVGMYGLPRGETPDAIVVTYGTGVVEGIKAAASVPNNVLIVDSPLISHASHGLRSVLSEQYPETPVVFADICKQGMSPLAGVVSQLASTSDCLVGRSWTMASASPTYNPLGSMCTFLDEDDIREAITRVLNLDFTRSLRTERSTPAEPAMADRAETG